MLKFYLNFYKKLKSPPQKVSKFTTYFKSTTKNEVPWPVRPSVNNFLNTHCKTHQKRVLYESQSLLLPSKHKQTHSTETLRVTLQKTFVPKVCHAREPNSRHKKKKTSKEKSETISFVFVINNRFTFRCYDYAKKVITKSTFSWNVYGLISLKEISVETLMVAWIRQKLVRGIWY